MRLKLVLYKEEKTAQALLFERPVLAESHVESRLRPRYGVFDIFDLSYGGISVIDIRTMDGINLGGLIVVACFGGLRTETWED